MRYVIHWDADARTWRVTLNGREVGSFDTLLAAERWVDEQPEQAS